MSKVYVVMCKQEFPEYDAGTHVFVYIVDVVANDVLAMDLLIDCQKRDEYITQHYAELADEYAVPDDVASDPNLQNEFDERYDPHADSHEYWFDTWEVREK